MQACSEENERLNNEIIEKKELEEEIERLKKELANEKADKERIRMEKEVQERLTRKLNEKISSFKIHLKDKEHERDDFLGSDKSVEYYKDLSNKRLKESMQLAEQLICIRSDLEKKSVQLMKYQLKPNASYYSEPNTGLIDKTPKSEIYFGTRQGSSSAIACHPEQPPEPHSQKPKPYPLFTNDKKESSTPTTVKRKGSGYISGQNSSHAQKLQPPNIPYQTLYHPHK